MADRQTAKNLDPMRAGACLLATVTAMREHDDLRASAVVGFAENAFCDDEHAIG
jgi:hypothetical protein